MNSVLERVYEIGIIPVIAFNSVDEAIPLCKALMDGGLPAAEVTFRTACAEECIKKIHEELPNMLLGAGTVLTVDQADRAMAAGASFIVAPGFDPEVCMVKILFCNPALYKYSILTSTRYSQLINACFYLCHNCSLKICVFLQYIISVIHFLVNIRLNRKQNIHNRHIIF